MTSPNQGCQFERPLQVVRVADGAVVATGRTGDPNISFSIAVQPKQAAGTQLQVVAPQTKSCKAGTSGVLTAIP